MEKHTLVSVRALPRQGYDSFYRGGQRWSSTSETFAYVTPSLLKILKAESMLAVDTGAEPDEATDLSQIPRLDVPVRPYIDEGAQALEEAAKLDREIAMEKAKLDVARKRAELESLRKKTAAITPPPAEDRKPS